jgi:hypothetical protein
MDIPWTPRSFTSPPTKRIPQFRFTPTSQIPLPTVPSSIPLPPIALVIPQKLADSKTDVVPPKLTDLTENGINQVKSESLFNYIHFSFSNKEAK